MFKIFHLSLLYIVPSFKLSLTSHQCLNNNYCCFVSEFSLLHQCIISYLLLNYSVMKFGELYPLMSLFSGKNGFLYEIGK